MAFPLFSRSPSTDLELLHRGSPLLLSWEAQPPEALLPTLSSRATKQRPISHLHHWCTRPFSSHSAPPADSPPLSPF